MKTTFIFCARLGQL